MQRVTKAKLSQQRKRDASDNLDSAQLSVSLDQAQLPGWKRPLLGKLTKLLLNAKSFSGSIARKKALVNEINGLFAATETCLSLEAENVARRLDLDRNGYFIVRSTGNATRGFKKLELALQLYKRKGKSGA